MDLHLSLHGRTDLSGQIYRQLRSAILDGRLPPGERLPSTRDLATQLGVSRKTTLDVFERLLAESFLLSKPGHGTFVADGPQRLPQTQAAPQQARPSPVWQAMPPALALQSRSLHADDFMGGVTDKSRFPFEPWRRCMNHALRLQARGRGGYHDPAGEQELRLGISRYLGFNRAVACSWQDVIVTQGAQQALDLLARVLLQPGDIVAMEEPGYAPARACFNAVGARVISVPVDAEGMRVDALPDQARLVYVTPSHQFPLGVPLSLDRRIALLEWAQRSGAVIAEDDYDGEFRFEGRPLDALKSLDRAGLVAYVGTFSKTIFPELRVGYLVPPQSLAAALIKAKQLSDWHSASLTQAALARFMLDGEFARHLRRNHKLYQARRAMLIRHLSGPLAPWFRPIVTMAGIHMTALLRPGIDEDAVIACGDAVQVGLYGTRHFYADSPAQPALLFGYGEIDVCRIDAALTRLEQALRERMPVVT